MAMSLGFIFIVLYFFIAIVDRNFGLGMTFAARLVSDLFITFVISAIFLYKGLFNTRVM